MAVRFKCKHINFSSLPAARAHRLFHKAEAATSAGSKRELGCSAELGFRNTLTFQTGSCGSRDLLQLADLLQLWEELIKKMKVLGKAG